uniref:E3 ubiquitin ligase TRAF3IP2 n=1 Tax=Phallusia mammillata TaxID=59560 RepID=A0A6F9DHV3_9ASCI|nr:uncharacterized protein LOC100187055 [Phallusia mammillata]
MSQSVGMMNGGYSRVVQLEAEPEDEQPPSNDYSNRVVETALNMAMSRQPVQHPAGNGSPEHSQGLMGMQRYPQQVHLPPHMPYPVNHQQGPSSNPSVEYCHYHSNQDSQSFFLTSYNSANGSTTGMVQPGSNTHVYYPPNRSMSSPNQVQMGDQPGLDRFTRHQSTPTKLVHKSDDNRCMANASASSSTTSLSQYGTLSYNGNTPGLDNMTGLQQSLTDISRPDSIEPTAQATGGGKRHSTESDTCDDISFRTVNPSYEDSECSASQSNHARAGNVMQRDDHISSISANIPQHLNSGSNNMTNSTQPYSPTPPGGSDYRVQRSQSRTSATGKKPKATVFITYAGEVNNQRHIRTVVQIAQTLAKNSIEISVDMLEENMRSMSISEWLEEKITRCDFVLICISPGYKQMIDMEDGNPIDYREQTLNTKYIYRRIHNEYIRNGSKNYRFIPVLLSDGRREHIPHWLCDTKVYSWPKDYEDIIFRLYRMEKYVKPPLGEMPTHTVEQYSSFSLNPGTSNRSNPRS